MSTTIATTPQAVVDDTARRFTAIFHRLGQPGEGEAAGSRLNAAAMSCKVSLTEFSVIHGDPDKIRENQQQQIIVLQEYLRSQADNYKILITTYQDEIAELRTEWRDLGEKLAVAQEELFQERSKCPPPASAREAASLRRQIDDLVREHEAECDGLMTNISQTEQQCESMLDTAHAERDAAIAERDAAIAELAALKAATAASAAVDATPVSVAPDPAAAAEIAELRATIHRRQDDLHDLVSGWLDRQPDTLTRIATRDIIQGAFGLDAPVCAETYRSVARIMRDIGYWQPSTSIKFGSTRVRGYVKRPYLVGTPDRKLC